MNHMILYVFGLMSLVWGIIIFLVSFIPYYTKGTILFGITLPESQKNNIKLHKLKENFSWLSIIIGIILALLSSITYFYFHSLQSVWIQLIAIIFYLLLVSIIYIRNYRNIKNLKEQNNWSANLKSKKVEDNSSIISSNFNQYLYLVLFLIVAIEICIVIYLYPKIPESIPMHINVEGVITHYVSKSVGNLAILPIIQLLIIGLFVGISFAINKARNDNNQKNDQVYKNSLQHMLYFLSILVILLISIFEITLTGLISVRNLFILPILYVIILFITVVYFSIKIRKSNQHTSVNENIQHSDNDDFWKLGLFYINKKDKALFVENRIGFGITLNLGNKFSWVIIASFVIFIVCVLVLPHLL